MSRSHDTIAAISTPIGTGGIGIVRVSGDKAFEIASKIFFTPNKREKIKDRKMVLGAIRDPLTDEEIDEVLLCAMRSPKTYTTEDVVEINCHGGPVALMGTLALVTRMGARIAEPGEFTKRAFLNGRIDLSQAEAVAELINAKSEGSMKVALNRVRGRLSRKVEESLDELMNVRAEVEALLDFEEEDLEALDGEDLARRLTKSNEKLNTLLERSRRGGPLRDGVTVVIAGRPNVGKSSLLNSLLMKDRAIVTSTPGTTRDLIEEGFSVKGLGVRLLDTAGIREPGNEIEQIGINKSREAIEMADLIILVIDSSKPLAPEDHTLLGSIDLSKAIVALNKCDLPGKVKAQDVQGLGVERVTMTSALVGFGIEEFCDELYKCALGMEPFVGEETIICSFRQTASLERAVKFVRRAIDAVSEGMDEEIIAEELREASEALGEMVGKNVSDILLDEIFSKFCIGK